MAVDFIDRISLTVTAGDGGAGVASVRREKFRPLGGPDGGNGGRGGSVILVVDAQMTTLLDYHRVPHRKAPNGAPGAGDDRNGADGEDMILPVPNGTVVKTASGQVLADLVGAGTRFVVAAGGNGGLGNRALATRKRKAPGFALLGEPGESRTVVLELKSLADVALIGFPSAGKSSLVSVLSAAKPKIAEYPFTTLVPNLGVVNAGDTRYTIADVPGLIPGAHKGKGLGLDFLRHVERCTVLVHVVDCATMEPGRDPLTDIAVIEAELAAYEGDDSLGGVPLEQRERVVVLNKADVTEAAELAEMVTPMLQEQGWEVYTISAVAHQGLSAVSYALGQKVVAARKLSQVAAEKRVVLRPPAVDEGSFRIRNEGGPGLGTFRVLGAKPSRWVLQTNFDNEEAVGYLADRLARLGVEDALFAAGAVAGSTVIIGPEDNSVVFDWEPTMPAGAEQLGARGTDLRFDERARPTRAEKRDIFHARKDAETRVREEMAAQRAAGVWTDDDDSGRISPADVSADDSAAPDIEQS